MTCRRKDGTDQYPVVSFVRRRPKRAGPITESQSGQWRIAGQTWEILGANRQNIDRSRTMSRA